MSGKKKIIFTLFALVAVAALSVAAYLVLIPSGDKVTAVPPEPPPADVFEPYEEVEPESEPDGEMVFLETYPVGKLIETRGRQQYGDGEMRLCVPSMGFEGDVFAGTDNATLAKGVGLFEYSMLPGRNLENSNVSIAGHRDIRGQEFYDIDKVSVGDQVYLLIDGALFTYEVEDILETDPYNWDPIRVKEYSCVTLQSCTPIGIASHRIFVVGRLVSVEEGKDFPG